MKTFLIAIAAAALALVAGAAQSQQYPQRPVRIVVPFPPGGGVDTLARIVGQKLSGPLGQSVVIDNRAGATGIIGTDHVAKSAPDGYTILIGTPGPMTIASAAGRKISYDPLADFSSITMGVRLTPVLVVSPDAGIANVGDLVARAKGRPGGLTYASGGVGNSQHLAGELFKQAAAIDVVHVPYKGSAPAQTAVMAKEADYFFSDPSALPLVRAGKLRALAVSTEKRSPALPDVPTVSESGVPGYVYFNWYSFTAPAHTPRPVIERLHREIVAVLNSPDVVEKLMATGMEPSPSTPEELDAFMRRDRDVWAGTIRSAKLKLE
jgi:tripartite-type tricarboxylate transporter receptor subunit TctC